MKKLLVVSLLSFAAMNACEHKGETHALTPENLQLCLLKRLEKGEERTAIIADLTQCIQDLQTKETIAAEQAEELLASLQKTSSEVKE